MKRMLFICLFLVGCERIEDKSNVMIANCYTDSEQRFIEFELMPYEGEEMTREQGLELLAETISADSGKGWQCE